YTTNQSGPTLRSIDHREPAVRPGEDRDQAPGRHAVGAAPVGRRLAVLVEDLPRHRAAAVPAHPVRPGQDRFAAIVDGDDRVLAALARSGGGYRFGGLAGGRVDAG